MTAYRVYVLPRAGKEIDRLPGNLRQRVRRAVISLRDDPQPGFASHLDYDLGSGRELWQLRVESWRVVYMIDREPGGIRILTVRRRPPYRYEDLASLPADVG